MRTLDETDRKRIHAWFDHLADWDENEYVRTHSHRLEAVPGAQVLKTTTDLRIFFRIDGDTITILDIAKKHAILATLGIAEGDV